MTIHSINCDTLFFTGNRSGMNQNIHIGCEVNTHKIIMDNPIKSISLETEKLKNGFDDTAIELNQQNIRFIKDIDFNNVAVSNFSGGGGGGGLPITGDGNISIGTGNISIANGTFTSTSGDIQTGGTADIVSGRNFILDGDTIQKRIDSEGVITLTEYTQFKDCARKSSNNNFTTQQTFTDNILMSGSNKTLNNSQGSIISGIGNIESIICGTVDCDNGGSNSVSAKQYNLRTSSATIAGWSLEQGEESNPAEQVDKVLQIQAGEAGGYITITPTDFAGTDPAIVLDPNDTANGGRIYASNFTLGTTANRYRLTQDLTGGLSDTLQISAPTANSKVEFRDNSNNVILDVNKTEVVLGATIPINFGAYSFRPIQYYKDITAFSFNNSALGPTNKIFGTNDTDWVNVNTGATGQTLNLGVVANRGAYKLAIRQSNAGTLGQINSLYIISDIALSRPNDGDPNSTLPSPSAYAFEAYDGTSAPVITTTPGSFVMNVYAQFPGVSGNETSNVRITLTKMDFFA
jgi:hypothetical protein